MSGRITLTPGELRDSAKRYQDGHDGVSEILATLRREQDVISGNWEGDAFRSFDEQFSELAPTIQEFADLLQDIRVQLDKVAEIIEQTDADIASQIRG